MLLMDLDSSTVIAVGPAANQNTEALFLFCKRFLWKMSKSGVIITFWVYSLRYINEDRGVKVDKDGRCFMGTSKSEVIAIFFLL